MSFVMSAGLVQIETALANLGNRPADRLMLVQDCFRHFDMSKVGEDSTHLSLFEMPGAFLFGAREPALEWLWDFVTQVLCLDVSRLYVTYFSGAQFQDVWLPADELTYQTWVRIGVPSSQLVGGDFQLNYWVQGNLGRAENEELERRCGPNTEIYYDLGAPLHADCQPGCSCGRFIEFANVLFISQTVHETVFSPMTEPFTEIVIGTQRLAMILQGAANIFELTEYQPVLTQIRQAAIARDEISEYQLLDYLRSLYLLIADGAPPPGKDGRQRIMKLLIRHVITRLILLGITDPLVLPQLMHTVALQFPNIEAKPVIARFASYIQHEESRFQQTIQRGQHSIQKLLAAHGQLDEQHIIDLQRYKGIPAVLTRYLVKKSYEV